MSEPTSNISIQYLLTEKIEALKVNGKLEFWKATYVLTGVVCELAAMVTASVLAISFIQETTTSRKFYGCLFVGSAILSRICVNGWKTPTSPPEPSKSSPQLPKLDSTSSQSAVTLREPSMSSRQLLYCPNGKELLLYWKNDPKTAKIFRNQYDEHASLAFCVSQALPRIFLAEALKKRWEISTELIETANRRKKIPGEMLTTLRNLLLDCMKRPSSSFSSGSSFSSSSPSSSSPHTDTPNAPLMPLQLHCPDAKAILSCWQQAPGKPNKKPSIYVDFTVAIKVENELKSLFNHKDLVQESDVSTMLIEDANKRCLLSEQDLTNLKDVLLKCCMQSPPS